MFKIKKTHNNFTVKIFYINPNSIKCIKMNNEKNPVGFAELVEGVIYFGNA